MSVRTRGRTAQDIAGAVFRLREIGIVVALGVAVLFFAVRAPNFLTVTNWQAIAKDVAIVLVVGVGEMLVILTRNIDLSVGSIVGLCAYLAAAVLVGLVGNAVAGAWWLDPLVGLLIAGLAVHEGRESWRGDACCH